MSMRDRGQHRFREPLDNRYIQYMVPTKLDGRCKHCGSALVFIPDHVERMPYDSHSGGYQVEDLPITGVLNGRGTCTKCGAITGSISWPADALYKFPLAGGDLWAWNRDYLEVLLAKISGDQAKERKIRHAHDFKMNGYFSYFLARLPKHVLFKKNRLYLVREISRRLTE